MSFVPEPRLPSDGAAPHIIEVDLPAPEVAIFRTRTSTIVLVDRRVPRDRRRKAIAAARVLATIDDAPLPMARCGRA